MGVSIKTSKSSCPLCVFSWMIANYQEEHAEEVRDVQQKEGISKKPSPLLAEFKKQKSYPDEDNKKKHRLAKQMPVDSKASKP